MAQRFSIEHKQLDEWTVALRSASDDALPQAKKVVAKGALNVKVDAKRRAPTGPHLPYYANSISYDTRETKTAALAEIGPDKLRRQGPLGNLLEYGSPTSPPHPHMLPAGEAEAPRFEQAMQDLAAKLLDPK